MGTLDQQLLLPKIDFAGLDPENPRGDAWNAARAQVMQALESLSAFEAIYDDRISLDVRKAFFGGVLKDAYLLPLEAKMRNSSDKPYHGYIGPTVMTGAEYETFAIQSAHRREDADAFTKLLWPEGNPSFSDALYAMAKPLADLELMVRRMVAESLGIEKHLDSLIEGSKSVLRVSQYQAPEEAGEKIGLHIHTDLGFISIVCQHEIPGLQVLSKDGGWVLPSLNSITILVGDAFSVWTNGRLEPCRHRVLVAGHERRYASILSIYPKDDYEVKPPEELVDEEHPLQFKSFYHNDYFRFYFSEAGRKAESVVKAYCGVGENQVEA